MESPKEMVEKNQKNALASTGPKTPEGKERSSQNAMVHGRRSERTVIPGEDFREWEGFEAAVASDLNASSQTEKALASHIASALWRLARGPRFEAETIHQNLTEASLERAYEAHLNDMPVLVRMKHVNADDVLKAERELHECLDYLRWYNDTHDFCKLLPTFDPSMEILVDFPEEIGKLVKAPAHAIKTVVDRGEAAKVQDVLDLISAGKVSLEKLTAFMEKRLEAKVKEGQKLEEKRDKVKANYKAAVATFSSTRLLPQADELTRLQAYEAHNHRNLQRSLEAFKIYREIKSAPQDIQTSGRVASFAKKEGKK